MEENNLKKEIINYAETISMGLKDSSSTLMETLEKEEEKARLEREKYEALNASLKEDIRRQKEEYDKQIQLEEIKTLDDITNSRRKA